MTLPKPSGMEHSNNESSSTESPPAAMVASSSAPPPPPAATPVPPPQAESMNSVRLCGTTAAPCGYCNGDRAALLEDTTAQNCSKSYGFLAVGPLQLQDYEALIERGWRRSGLHIYKPHNFKSCCPALTIRLPVKHFQPTKSQKRVIKKLNKVLNPKRRASRQSTLPTASRNGRRRRRSSSATISSADSSQLRSVLTQNTLHVLAEVTGQAHNLELIKFRMLQQKRPRRQPNHAGPGTAPAGTVSAPTSTNCTTWMTPICAVIAGRSRGAIQREELSKSIAEALQQKMNEKAVVAAFGRMLVEAHEESGQVLVRIEDTTGAVRLPFLTKAGSGTGSDESLATTTSSSSKQTPLQEYADSDPTDTSISTAGTMDLAERDIVGELLQKPTVEPPYEFSIRTIPAAESALMPEVHKLFFDYQCSVHNDPHPLRESPQDQDLDWGDLSADFRKEASSMLQRLYGQTLSPERQHGVACAFSSFCRFLVESPLPTRIDGQAALDKTGSGGRVGGTFHQHYRIAGQLVAVGVVDVLQGGLSSVYVFYSPEWSRHIPLGKLAVLKEIEYTSETLQLPYYYLGYYIESCGKMRYKADFMPSQLLCPATYEWVDYSEAHATLLRESPERHCCKLFGGVSEEDEAERQRVIEGMALDVGAGNGTLVTLSMLQDQGQALIRPHVEEYVQQAGHVMSQRSVIRLV